VKSISGRAFAKLLEREGWVLRRINGSHHIYVKPGKVERLSIPIHANEDLKHGLLRHLMKLADLDESHF